MNRRLQLTVVTTLIFLSVPFIGESEIFNEGISGENLKYEEISYNNNDENIEIATDETIITEPVVQVEPAEEETILQGVGTGDFAAPVSGTFTSGYGQRWGRLHGGIDLAAETGTPISAADSGKVIFAGECNSYGLLIKVDHSNGYITYYAHCSGFIADVGDYVEKGEQIAYVGNTGNSTGPHCHFEIRYDNQPKNPLNYIDI